MSKNHYIKYEMKLRDFNTHKVTTIKSGICQDIEILTKEFPPEDYIAEMKIKIIED